MCHILTDTLLQSKAGKLPRTLTSSLTAAGEPAVIVKGEFTWDLASPATLMDMDVTVPAGSFVAIVGPTGHRPTI